MSTISASTTSTTAYKVTADTTGTLVLQTGATPTTAVTIDGSQNVGIGTSSPTQKVTVVGDISIKTGNKLYLWDSTNAYAPNIKNASADNITFNTSSNVETMRIDSSGNLLVGTTSAVAKVTVYGATGNCASFQNDSGTTRFPVLFYNGVSNVGNIATGVATTSYNTSSDYRLKENITPMTGALAKVALLKPVTYKWKVDGADGQGFIAHELAEVCPDAVSGEKDAVDAEGNPVYQGIDVSFLVGTLTAAIQELKAELDAAKADIATLKGQA